MSEDQIRAIAAAFGPEAKVVRGKFAVNVGYKGGAALLAGTCRGVDLTDRPEGCEAIAATVIVIPHIGVRLPPLTSVDYFLAEADSIIDAAALAEAMDETGDGR